MSFAYLKEITDRVKESKKPFWQVVMEDDMQERNVSGEESFETMRGMYLAMKQADASYDPLLRSASGLAGGDGKKLEEFRKNPNRLIGDFLTEVMEKAVKMGESNACMKRIVAAPTAGSCGVIPAVLLTYGEQKDVSEEQLVRALFVAAGIGEVLAESASIAGAEGGCQAEIGTASAMAAAALADGTSCIRENVFENRFCVAKELQKLGAHIIIENKLAVVDGVNTLKGTRVAAEDLRGGAALAVAALAADGTSFLDGYEHISRGYEDIRSDLAGAGARISLIG